jgi:two-component system response regulator LytT
MNTISVLIIEDEIPAQRMLKGMLAELDYPIAVVGLLPSIQASVAWFSNNPHPDLVLMDIQLSDGISFDILDKVVIDSMIIFTTAYEEYAIQAFKVNSLDYLLKPFAIDDLNRAFSKYQHYNKNSLKERNASIDFAEMATAISEAKTDYRKRFLIQTNDEYIRLPIEKVAYFHSIAKVTYAVTFDQRKYPLDCSLQALTEQLNPDQFFKVNRQYIVSIDAIHKIQSYFQGKLVLDTRPRPPEKLIVGKDKAASFKRWLDK